MATERGDSASAAAALVEACEFLTQHNVSGMMQAIGTMAAGELIPLGRFAEARELPRRALSAHPTGAPALLAHMTALRLSLREGGLDEAARHPRRLHELVADPAGFVEWEFPIVPAEYETATKAP